MSSSPSSSLLQALAHLLGRWRAERGWSLRDVSERAGLSIPYLSELERGRKAPSFDALEQLAAAYGVSLSQLLCALAIAVEQREATGRTLSPALLEALLALEETEQQEVLRYVQYLRWLRGQSC